MCLHNFTNEQSECLLKYDWSEAIAQADHCSALCFNLIFNLQFSILNFSKYSINIKLCFLILNFLKPYINVKFSILIFNFQANTHRLKLVLLLQNGTELIFNFQFSIFYPKPSLKFYRYKYDYVVKSEH